MFLILSAKVASSDVPVLLSGEGGTGKGAAARAIHQTCNRKERPFVAINCGAIPEAVLYRELFGYEKDSFPGAQAQGQGKFDLARGGTIFLNEIAEISLGVQSQLLRVVEDQCFDRFGGRAPIKIDVRIIAATNLDLKKGMWDGTFREDLYYRLSVVHIVLPPLRERERDIRSLGQFFLKQFGRQANKNDLSFDQDALRAMDRYPWPGNVRQLENCVRRAVIIF
jgi:transcriptional regulator with GAF, ATPase, and Fis domain